MFLKAAFCAVLVFSVLQSTTPEELERDSRAYTDAAGWLMTLKPQKTAPTGANSCSDLCSIRVHDECAMKIALVAQHNAFRRTYKEEVEALGCPERAPGDLEWDHELATLSQLWANMCTAGHGYLYTQCEGNTAGYGQNVYWSTTDYARAQSNMLKRVVSAWNDDEKPYTNLCTHACSNPYGPCGHFIAVINKHYTRVGCAYTDPDHKCTKNDGGVLLGNAD